MKTPSRPPLYDSLYAVVREIPRGRVATYGQVARLAGLGRRARMAGRALRLCDPSDRVPWQRVVNAQGRLSTRPGAPEALAIQRRLLEKEGVRFGPAGRIDLARYLWDPGPASLLPRSAPPTRAERGLSRRR